MGVLAGDGGVVLEPFDELPVEPPPPPLLNEPPGVVVVVVVLELLVLVVVVLPLPPHAAALTASVQHMASNNWPDEG